MPPHHTSIKRSADKTLTLACHPALARAPQVCCFDKTGTLTSDHLLLEGLVGVPGRGGELVTDLKKLPNSVAEVRAWRARGG